ncbi:uncharacterized protein LOC114857930 [Betta splendens]|uniref:Uncharacterized protein LOC114857930 n=1 Tax=Betta splendens TaxID=158456 RepID=A0A6P7MWW8_BETSP|nr:uncharacterized protein LOC114857930 [Betta splendens]
MGRFAVMAAVFLLGCSLLSAADTDTCKVYAAVGKNLTLSFELSYKLSSRDGLKWTHNGTTVYWRDSSGLIYLMADSVSSTGSLLLNNLQFSSAGFYEATVSNPSQRETKIWSGRVCVVDAVTKPQLTYDCDFKAGAVVLNCKAPSPQALLFSWTLGTTLLQKEMGQTLRLPLERLKGGSVACVVNNKASGANSDAVLPVCKSPTPPPRVPAPGPGQVCLPLKTFGAMLVGGAGLVLVLLIVIIVLCCRHKRTGAQMRSGNKAELRLTSVNKQELGSIGPDYETMPASEDYPCPSPRPSPRACKNTAEAQQKPLLAAPAEEEQKPSPVPKPRTKLTQTPDA